MKETQHSKVCLGAQGGGEGMGAIEQTLDALDARLGGACQVVAICGRNKALTERLQRRCLSLDILCMQQKSSLSICSALSLCICEILSCVVMR